MPLFNPPPAALPPDGAAGGDLSGTYPNPEVAQVGGQALPLPLTLGGTGHDAASAAALLTALGAAALAGAAFAGEVTVQTPVNASDAVTKAYADAIAQGLSVKPSAQEATAAALPSNTYSNGSSGVGATLTGVATGVLTVDGIAVSLNDRVLVKNEVTGANNGLYQCTLAGAVGVAYVLTRATDMNTAAQVPGAFAFVEQGTANAGAGFTVASEGPFTIGTTAITWTQFSGAGEITAGTGLSKSGNTLSLTTPALPLAGGTMSGAIAMGANKVTGLANGSAGTDAAAFGQIPIPVYGGIFGNGSNGSATLDGTATVAWASKSGSVYTMTADAFCTNLTVNSGVTLNTAGCRIFCTGTFSNAGTVQSLGANASAQTAGAAGATGFAGTGGAGGNGSQGGGSSGGSPALGARNGCGNPGSGGNGSNGGGGGGGGSGNPADPYYVPQPALVGCFYYVGALRSTSGAAGGGGGSGDGTNYGGGGGAGGGCVVILAWSAVNTGTISAAGGNGATPSTGNCGGGGAGGGGIILAYTLSAWTAGTTSVAAGSNGSGVGTGTAGGAGSAGTVLNVVIQ